MARKTHHISVKASSYTDAAGQTRNKWVQIGSVLEGQYGPYIVLEKHINLAGLPGNGSVVASMFPVEDSPPPDTGSYPGQNRTKDLDDEIPF